MKFNPLKKLRGSLFLKILILFTLAIIIAIILPRITFLFFFHPQRFPVMQKHAVNHARYIKDDLGNPPDIEKARQLSSEAGIQIRIQTPDINWASHQGMIDFPNLILPVYDEKENIHAGFTKQGLCVSFTQNSNRILLVMRPRIEEIRNLAGLFSLIIGAMVTLLIINMYFILRWLLKPIRVLHEGVNQLSAGNIDTRINTKRSDELGKLIHSFNTMTARIREMIQARERLLLDVSHELRSPLTRIKLALEFVEDQEAGKNIRDDISELETKITELLETERLKSQHGKLKLKKTRLRHLLEDVCRDFQNHKPGVRIVHFPENIYLKLDPERMKILFRNILDNAIRHSSPEAYPVEISCREKPDEFTIVIQDFGSGIPENELPFIFEPFYRVDKSRSKKTGGYGLGMSLSKQIMEAHGGCIEVSSRIKVGTTVFLKFKK
jgi:signal transduction histidine kinase